MAYPILSIQLLGEFSLVYDGMVVVGVNTARMQSLLAYLILHADLPQLRQHLAFRLWPDSGESQARNNLRQLLFQLRQVLPDAKRFLAVDASSVYWRTDAQQVIDIRLFDQGLQAVETADPPHLRSILERTLVYYQGDLLPGCYDEWILPERERRQQQYVAAGHKLLQLLENERQYGAAIQVAQQLLQLDALNEDTYVWLIRLFELNGDRVGAGRVYQTAVTTFQRELGISPGEALQVAFDTLQKSPHILTHPGADDATNDKPFSLIGRQKEWAQLQAAWQRAASSTAHLVLITGEAGIGKSRLAEELFNWAARQSLTAAYTRCYSSEGRLSFAPVTEWLRSKALRPHLAALEPIWLTEITRLLPELLDEYSELDRPEPVTEYGRRRRFFEALARGILIAPSPLVLWLDDLQWCDTETLEWLHFLLRFQPHHPLLIVGTARSGESPPHSPLEGLERQLRAEDKISVIELSPLDAAETGKLAAQVQGYELDETANVHLYRETEGNPFFVVEMVRAGLVTSLTPKLERETTLFTLHSSLLPPRVQAVIVGRLAQLSPTARKVAEIGAANGRAFTLDLLLKMASEDEETIVEALDELWQRRIVQEQSANVFDFTHDKLREMTYAGTSLPQRRLLHRRLAQAMEALYAAELEAISPQLAAHYEQAGLMERAILYYPRAASVAASVYANEEATNLLTHALGLLKALPTNEERELQELNIQLELATLYRINKGWTSPEEEQVMNRVIVLSERVGSIEQRLRALFGLQTLYVVQAQYRRVERISGQIEKLFEETVMVPPPFIEIYLAGARFHRGQIVEAREGFEKIIALRDDKRIRDLQESQGLNYLVHGLAWNAHALWCLGYPQAALQAGEVAVEFAREFVQPFNQALAVTYLAMLQAWCADRETFYAAAATAYALTDEYKAPYYRVWSGILLKFAQAEQTPDEAHLALLHDAIDSFMKTGARIRLATYFSMLAQICLEAGRLAEGLAALEQALAVSQQYDEHWWDAEIYRWRGELLRAQGAKADEVEAALQRALEIAQSQQAKSFELRAATSLARLWQGNGRSAQGKELLSPIYAWFNEGFDTPDLQSAKALIDQL